MKSFRKWVWVGVVLMLVAGSGNALAGEKKIVIAHRGACGYLPEHTLEAKAMAYGMGADYIEQDVVLTRDDRAMVLHDIHIDTVTDVAKVFPDRKREDGRYYAIDFTLDEIKKLNVTERMDLETGKPVFPGRFPAGKSEFRVPTLEEEIELIQGLNKSTGKDVGIYPEIKSPAWHRSEGKDISKIVVAILNKYGYNTHESKCYLQCFDPNETRRLKNELGVKVKLVQLLAETDWEETPVYEGKKKVGNYDYEPLKTREGLAEIAKYADGIGPWMPQIVKGRGEGGKLIITDLVKNAHEVGLEVHPYTLRADSLPDYADGSFDRVLEIFYNEVGVDGLFTDFADKAVKFFQIEKIKSQIL